MAYLLRLYQQKPLRQAGDEFGETPDAGEFGGQPRVSFLGSLVQFVEEGFNLRFGEPFNWALEYHT